jgi:hypothetical protein
MVCVASGELDNPKVYIKKSNSDTYHIMPISTEAVIDLLTKYESIDFTKFA